MHNYAYTLRSVEDEKTALEFGTASVRVSSTSHFFFYSGFRRRVSCGRGGGGLRIVRIGHLRVPCLALVLFYKRSINV